MLLHIRIFYFLFKFMEQIVVMIQFYCLPFSFHVLLLLCPFSVIALRNSNSKFEFKAIQVQSSLPLGLMCPPRAAERRRFEGLQLLLLPLVPSDRARRILRLASLCLAGRPPFP